MVASVEGKDDRGLGGISRFCCCPRPFPKLTLALLLVFCSAVRARPADFDYRELASHAGIIFRGTVEAVERIPAAAPGEVSTVRVTFRVGEAVSGASSGELLTITQWEGADAGYRPGEAVVLFLYPPSGELGLTSTVGGQLGRVPAEQAETALAAAREARMCGAAGPDIVPDPDLPQGKGERRRPARERSPDLAPEAQ